MTILQQLQTYLQQHPQASLLELAAHCQANTEVLREMLARLERKGRVKKLDGKQCAGCHHCAPESLEIYRWICAHSARL